MAKISPQTSLESGVCDTCGRALVQDKRSGNLGCPTCGYVISPENEHAPIPTQAVYLDLRPFVESQPDYADLLRKKKPAASRDVDRIIVGACRLFRHDEPTLKTWKMLDAWLRAKCDRGESVYNMTLRSIADALEAENQSAERPSGPTPPTPAASKDNPNDKRDKFAYTSLKAGKSLQEIKNKINNKQTWEPLESLQGVSAAAKRYARRHSLPWPIVQH